MGVMVPMVERESSKNWLQPFDLIGFCFGFEDLEVIVIT